MKTMLRVALVGVFLLVPRARAQDVTMGEIVPFQMEALPNELPQAKSPLRPAYPAEMRQSSEIGYVAITAFIDATGKRLVQQSIGTHMPFQHAIETSQADWNFRPAMQEGKPTPVQIWIPIIFNPASASLKGDNATPRLLTVAPVISPVRAAPAGSTPAVRMKLSLDASGVITQAVPVEDSVKPAVLTAIDAGLKNWRFSPARKNGQAVASEVVVSVLCQLPPQAAAGVNVPPKVLTRDRPEYPFVMRRFGLRGEVLLQFEVNEQGKVQNVVIVSSDNPGFDEAALKAVRTWTFQPGTQNGKPVTARLRVPIIFQLDNTPNGGATAYQVSDRADQSKLPPEMRYDTPPKFRGIVIPVYPYELRRDQIRGKAKVTALINPQGRVAAVKIMSADLPEFGLALATALEGFTFNPALKDGRGVQHLLGFEQVFSSTDLPDSVSDEMLSLEKRHPERIVGNGALDAPLKPISQAAPIFPRSLIGQVNQGEAVIEILVDEDGRVRLPRIVSASDPTFGYSAVQAISSWWFEPPKAHGKSVVARAQVPFKFETKAAGSTPAPAVAPNAPSPGQ